MGNHWRHSFQEVEILSRRNGVLVTKVEHRRKKYILVKRSIPCDGSLGLNGTLSLLQPLQRLKSDRLVTIYGFDVDTVKAKSSSFRELDVYLKFMEKGSFDKIYKQHGPIPISIVGEVALAVGEAMSFLYDDHQIVPRCIKPSNVLLSAHGKIRLCDYAMSTEVINSQPDSWVRTSYYTSPERVQGHELDQIKGDVWALGITLIELALGRFPYGRIQPPEVDWLTEGEDGSSQGIAIPSPGTVAEEPVMEADFKSLSVSPAQPSRDLPGLRIPVQPGEKDAPVQPGEKAPAGPSWVKQGVTWNGGEGTLSIIDLLRVIVFADAPRLPEGCFAQEIEKFVDGCLQKDSKARMTTKELLGHSWMSTVREKDVDVQSWASGI